MIEGLTNNACINADGLRTRAPKVENWLKYTEQRTAKEKNAKIKASTRVYID